MSHNNLIIEQKSHWKKFSLLVIPELNVHLCKENDLWQGTS